MTAVTAYECGYSEETLEQELKQAASQMSDNKVKPIHLLHQWDPALLLLIAMQV